MLPAHAAAYVRPERLGGEGLGTIELATLENHPKRYRFLSNIRQGQLYESN